MNKSCQQIVPLLVVLLSSIGMVASWQFRTRETSFRQIKISFPKAHDDVIANTKLTGGCFYFSDLVNHFGTLATPSDSEDVWFFGVFQFPPNADVGGGKISFRIDKDFASVLVQIPKKLDNNTLPVLEKIEVVGRTIPGESDAVKFKRVTNRIYDFELNFFERPPK